MLAKQSHFVERGDYYWLYRGKDESNARDYNAKTGFIPALEKMDDAIALVTALHISKHH